MTTDSLGRPTMTHQQEHARDNQYGPLVNMELLVEFIQPTIDRIGIAAFARLAGIHDRQVHALLRGEYRTRLYIADRILTRGLGRPDLVGLVCPDVVESRVGSSIVAPGTDTLEVA